MTPYLKTGLETQFDKWLFFLKNLLSFDHIPRILNEKVFSQAFDVAKLGNMEPEEREAYEKSFWDTNAYYSAMEESKLEGKIEAQSELIRNMLSTGLSIEQIASMTKLTLNEIKHLSNSISQ